MRKKRQQATHCARLWLESKQVNNNEKKSLQELGILLCENIISHKKPPVINTESICIQRPSIEHFIGADRTKILNWLRADINWNKEPWSPTDWSIVFGTLALSWAYDGDMQIVAHLLRTASNLYLQDYSLDAAEQYLLSQQTSNGNFGFFINTSLYAKDKKNTNSAHLLLTVEILWALCAREMITV